MNKVIIPSYKGAPLPLHSSLDPKTCLLLPYFLDYVFNVSG